MNWITLIIAIWAGLVLLVLAEKVTSAKRDIAKLQKEAAERVAESQTSIAEFGYKQVEVSTQGQLEAIREQAIRDAAMRDDR